MGPRKLIATRVEAEQEQYKSYHQSECTKEVDTAQSWLRAWVDRDVDEKPYHHRANDDERNLQKEGPSP